MNRKHLTIPDNVFNEIQEYLSTKTGIKFSDDKKRSLRIFLTDRINNPRIRVEPENYRLMLINRQSDEFREVVDWLTNHETYFFRNKSHFAGLKNFIIPNLIERKKQDEEINIWSAGCATGEEPYSMAIYLREYFFDNNLARFKIRGTDISPESIETAKAGIFYNRSFRDPANNYLVDRYFRRDGDKYLINDEIKSMVEFSPDNLLEGLSPFPEGRKIDLILCRNVFIYFNHETIRQVTDKFFNILHDDGFIIVGHSEAINQITDKFQPLIVGDTFVFQKTIEKKPSKNILKDLEIKPLKLEKYLEKNREKKPVKARVSKEEKVGREIEDQLFREALEDFNYERFSRAEEKVNSLLKLNAHHEFGIILLSNIYANERKYDEAESLCKKVLEQNPINSEAYFLLGIISMEKEDFSSAVKYFKQVLFLEPNCGYAYFQIAFAFQQMRLFTEALTNYRNAIRSLEKYKQHDFKTFRSLFENKQLIEFCNFNIKQIKKVF